MLYKINDWEQKIMFSLNNLTKITIWIRAQIAGTMSFGTVVIAVIVAMIFRR